MLLTAQLLRLTVLVAIWQGEMGFKMPPVLVIVAIVIAAVALLLQIVGVATTGWYVPDEGDGGFGLFKVCGSSSCSTLKAEGALDWLDACRAFGIIGVLVLVGCVVVGVLICFMEMDKLPLIAAILGFVAGLCCLIEFAVYAGETQDSDGYSLGYSFGLTIVACILAIVAGVLFLVGGKKAA